MIDFTSLSSQFVAEDIPRVFHDQFLPWRHPPSGTAGLCFLWLLPLITCGACIMSPSDPFITVLAAGTPAGTSLSARPLESPPHGDLKFSSEMVPEATRVGRT